MKRAAHNNIGAEFGFAFGQVAGQLPGKVRFCHDPEFRSLPVAAFKIGRMDPPSNFDGWRLFGAILKEQEAMELGA
jgi:hypothetical protein